MNFAVHLPLLDRLFGTYHLPRGRWPSAYGLAGGACQGGWLLPARPCRCAAARPS